MNAHGFTLLELLVALAIGAILAVLATAGHEQTLLRSHRLDARAALLAVASAQERHYLERGRYASRFADAAAVAAAAERDPADAPDDPLDGALPLAPTSPDGDYALELATDPDALGYTATARPRGAQRRDSRCTRFTLDHTGRRTASDARGADTTAACWR